MLHDSWDDAMLWYGSLIGYMAGVKAACKDEERLDLLLAMMQTQVKLEDVERENAKLRELTAMLYRCASRCLNDLGPSCLCSDEDGCGMDCVVNGEGCSMGLLEHRVRELGVEVN